MTNRNGYTLLWMPEHPAAWQGYVLEHRAVVEQQLGRRLHRSETVHHITEQKWNNDPKNLFACTMQEHQKAHR